MIQIDLKIPKCCKECLFYFSHGIMYDREKGEEWQYVCQARYKMDELSGKNRRDFEYKYDFTEEMAEKGRQSFCPLIEVKESIIAE